MASLVYRYNQELTASFDTDSTAAGTAFTGRLRFQTDTTAGAIGTANTTITMPSTPINGDMFFNTRSNQLNTWTGTNTTTTAGTWDIPSGDTLQFQVNWTGVFSEVGKLKNALMHIFEKVPKDLIKNEEDAKLVKAKAKSEKLLREWLSPAEYEGLKNKGEIELASQEEDVIFIVKRDPNAMVEVKKKGQHSHTLCMVAEDLDFPIGDQLLSKIAMIKTDEKAFKEMAIRHG